MDILMRVLADKLEKGEIKLEINSEVIAEIEKGMYGSPGAYPGDFGRRKHRGPGMF